ncbi:hypothetical protein EHS25_004916 [Saitozyma podzolica]|uniref:Uncharacterized protein n=1 Tax=Saitozyma podzolica TaxID=1890683 RepID=A0A427Y343_9TREE|nr:hypothetical protein EHS25_004916 [Saitozyma podzolica]
MPPWPPHPRDLPDLHPYTHDLRPLSKAQTFPLLNANNKKHPSRDTPTRYSSPPFTGDASHRRQVAGASSVRSSRHVIISFAESPRSAHHHWPNPVLSVFGAVLLPEKYDEKVVFQRMVVLLVFRYLGVDPEVQRRIVRQPYFRRPWQRLMDRCHTMAEDLCRQNWIHLTGDLIKFPRHKRDVISLREACQGCRREHPVCNSYTDILRYGRRYDFDTFRTRASRRLMHLVNIESLYEYRSRAGVWGILRLLEEYGIRCTSYMIGMALLQNPEVGRALVAGGHEVARYASIWVRERLHWGRN